VGRLSTKFFGSVGALARFRPKQTLTSASAGMLAGVSMTNVNSPPRGCQRFWAVTLTMPPYTFVLERSPLQVGASTAVADDAVLIMNAMMNAVMMNDRFVASRHCPLNTMH